MFVLKLPVREFISKAPEIWKEMKLKYKANYGEHANESEERSWKNSLPALAEVLSLSSDSVKNCLIYLEYGMPSYAGRADVVIAGLDARGHRAIVIIELKQWDARAIVVDGNNLKVGPELTIHPSDQALGYRDYLADLSKAFADLDTTLRSCAYLHKSSSHSLIPLTIQPFTKLTELSPIFAGDQQVQMSKWISDTLTAPPDSRYVTDLDSDEVCVSKNLFKTVAGAVKNEEGWVLLDEQKKVFNQILELVNEDDGEKHLVLVEGGPGTGKSVIAMQVMGKLSEKKVPAVHITNSSSFTTVMRALIQKKGDRIWGTRAVEGLFKLSHNWVKRKDRFEVAICDEGHRFRRATTFFPNLVSRRPQAEEIFENVRVLLAFVDEKQILRKEEAGTLDYFRECAINVGVKPENLHGPIRLEAQFRCAGSNAFIKALDEAIYEGHALGFAHPNFAILVHDSIEEMDEYLQERIDNKYSARIVGGFCWPWSNPNKDKSLVPDVEVGSWKRPWNRKPENRKYPAEEHPYFKWANRTTDQLGEVGCIYSAQGFEFDYVGVIWGRDLIRRDNKWEAHPEESYDPEMWKKGRKTPIDTAIALPLLKNAYRVLCSRAIRGCSIYCEDKETADFLRKALS